MSDAIVIIPTYNEEDNVERMTEKVMSLEKDFHILFVDDNSPDQTATIIKRLMDKYPGRIHIEEREGKLGLGNGVYPRFQMVTCATTTLTFLKWIVIFLIILMT